jgi:hypothetical protein
MHAGLVRDFWKMGGCFCKTEKRAATSRVGTETLRGAEEGELLRNLIYFPKFNLPFPFRGDKV